MRLGRALIGLDSWRARREVPGLRETGRWSDSDGRRQPRPGDSDVHVRARTHEPPTGAVLPGGAAGPGVTGLAFAPSWLDLVVDSPLGPGSLRIRNACGIAGDPCVTALTVTPGAFPYGWFFGVDITLPVLLAEIAFGPPFHGTLDPAGRSVWQVNGGVSAGLTLAAATATFSPPGGAFRPASRPVLFTTP